VLTAPDAEEALDAMAKHEVGVVLSDQRMPGTTGVELLEKVRLEFPATVRILITAHSDLAAAVDAINRGVVTSAGIYASRALCTSSGRRCATPSSTTSCGSGCGRWSAASSSPSAFTRSALVAAGLGRELVRPAESIRESVSLARTELREMVERFETQKVDKRLVCAKLAELEARLGYGARRRRESDEHRS